MDRLPVKLHEARNALVVDKPEGMDAKPLHRRKAARKRPVAHDPHQHVSRFRGQRDEVPERIMRRGRLGNLIVRLGLHGMDEVRKLDRILNEEDGDVVADEIPDALVRVEFDREPRTSRGVSADPRDPATVEKRTKTGVCFEGSPEQFRLGEMGQVLVDLEIAVRRGPARVDDPLRDSLVVEVSDLLAEVEILKQRRPALPSLERVLIVPDRQTLIGGKHVHGRRLYRVAAPRFSAFPGEPPQCPICPPGPKCATLGRGSPCPFEGLSLRISTAIWSRALP